MVDHQARFRWQIFSGLWLPNSGRASPGPAQDLLRLMGQLLPEGEHCQLLGPLPQRASLLRTFARDRRRAALRLPLNGTAAVHPSPGERQGRARQLWRRLLERQQLHRASDYAMFLLVYPTLVAKARDVGLTPLDFYLMDARELVDDMYREAHADDINIAPRASLGSLPYAGSDSLGPASQGPAAPAPSLSPTRPESIRRRQSGRIGSVGGASLAGLDVPMGGGRATGGPHRKTSSMVQVSQLPFPASAKSMPCSAALSSARPALPARLGTVSLALLPG